jgi:hypothetical protein
MGKRDENIRRDRSATCKRCGLTARNQIELDDHINHAHSANLAAESSSKNSPTERKLGLNH